MNNTKRHAQLELGILLKSFEGREDSLLIEDFFPEIVALCEKFGDSGQSGSSAPYVAKALADTIEKLCLQKTISPISGLSEEWGDVYNSGGNMLQQNKRCSGLFKDKDNNVRYIDAIVKRTQNGTCWSGSFWLSKEDYLTGNRDLMLSSSQLIKGFPFTPKTFYIDVIEEEVAPDDWEMYLKDPKQLEEVYEYYKKP
jgi:hypothetical protein